MYIIAKDMRVATQGYVAENQFECDVVTKYHASFIYCIMCFRQPQTEFDDQISRGESARRMNSICANEIDPERLVGKFTRYTTIIIFNMLLLCRYRR